MQITHKDFLRYKIEFFEKMRNPKLDLAIIKLKKELEELSQNDTTRNRDN